MDGFAVLFDLSESRTLSRALELVQELQTTEPSEAPIILVGNCLDRPREVSRKQGEVQVNISPLITFLKGSSC